MCGLRDRFPGTRAEGLKHRREVWGGLAVWGLLSLLAPPCLPLKASDAGAQSREALSRAAPSREADPLDVWIVTHYRSAHLLADSSVTASQSATPAAVTPSGPLPRIESVRGGRASDTLLAVHFGARQTAPVLSVASRPRLVGPNGTIAPLTARVALRRSFRAPRVPGADPAKEDQWRYGWAYLVVLPHDDERPAGRYHSWLLMPVTPTPPAL